MTETILVVACHSDDQVIGMGSTMAKYSQEGKEVICIIVSNGAGSSPWLKKDILIEERMQESLSVNKFLGCQQTFFLNATDGKVKEEIKDKKLALEVVRIINKYKPTRIFTHSEKDPHPDHQGTYELTVKALDIIDKKKQIGLYSFEVWNVVNQPEPRVYVDVSTTFHKKIKAMKMFKTQRTSVYTLLTPVIMRAFVSGFHAKCRYAERFYKLR